LQGASRVSGGIFRGRAAGNTPNAADFSGAASDALDDVAVPGIVSIYHCPTGPTDLGDPAENMCDFTVKIQYVLKPGTFCDLLLECESIIQGEHIY
jgi:hypothetical protein